MDKRSGYKEAWTPAGMRALKRVEARHNRQVVKLSIGHALAEMTAGEDEIDRLDRLRAEEEEREYQEWVAREVSARYEEEKMWEEDERAWDEYERKEAARLESYDPYGVYDELMAHHWNW